MKHTPKKYDMGVRILYSALLFVSLFSLNMGEGVYKSIFVSAGMILLVSGAYLLIRYELTSFTYIISRGEKGEELFVDKVVGRRGGYVCYYYLSDIVALERLGKGSKKDLREKYGKCFFYKYTNNLFTKSTHVVVFKNDGYYDCVIMELSSDMCEYIRNSINVNDK